MSFWELLLIAVGLSMDAFAVSVCKGLSVSRLQPKHVLLAGLYFGGFQFLMPVLGWLMGYRFEALITSIDHWVAFVLLAVIGGNMIKESFSRGETLSDDFGVKTMLLLAIATSIDALAVGITFAFLSVRILPAAALIGLTTFLLSGVGIYVGRIFGLKYKARAERAGGIILILIGTKILLEHLGILVI
ncbi:MAG: manganese efflux pump [Oscillospiraceae bacterium]|nr:manganese efflux pump [Oscillospiraceae bacterium]